MTAPTTAPTAAQTAAGNAALDAARIGDDHELSIAELDAQLPGRTWHTEPAFWRAHALFHAINDPTRNLLPIEQVSELVFAYADLTDHGQHAPTWWLPAEEVLPPTTHSDDDTTTSGTSSGTTSGTGHSVAEAGDTTAPNRGLLIAALTSLSNALTELMADSRDLATTVRYQRVRTQIREVLLDVGGTVPADRPRRDNGERA